MTAIGTGLIASPWFLLVLPLTICIDSMVPPVPGDEMLMAAAAFRHSSVGWLLLLLAIAAVAAFTGDQIAYAIGRVGLRRGGSMVLGPRRQKAFNLAREALARGGTPALLVARFLPGGRTAVNVLAGRLGYPPAQFRRATGLGASISMTYALLLGTFAGQFVHDRPLFVALGGMALGACVPVVIGLLRKAVRAWRRHQGHPAPERVDTGWGTAESAVPRQRVRRPRRAAGASDASG